MAIGPGNYGSSRLVVKLNGECGPGLVVGMSRAARRLAVEMKRIGAHRECHFPGV